MLFVAVAVAAEAQYKALSKKEQDVVAISIYTAQGDSTNLKAALAKGLETGLTVNEEKEIMLQLYAYCGFPRSMNALSVLTQLMKERKINGVKDNIGAEPIKVNVKDRIKYGEQNRLKLFGRPAQGEVLTYVPALDEMLKAHLFGDIYGRGVLDWKTREILTVAAISVMDGLDTEQNIHTAHAKHNGVTDAQIQEIMSMAERCRNHIFLDESEEPPKTFPADPNVIVRKVFYKNRLDIILAADMYMPVEMDTTTRHAALVIGHPFGGVKEQCAGLYAQEMAKRGYVTIAFDASYQGESGGTPRHTVSPDALVEDFSATVDWLGTQKFVDRDKIGVIGICGSGGFSVCATALDPRIKALVTVSMYDMGRVTRNGLVDKQTSEQRKKLLAEIAEQRWKEAEGGEKRIRFGTPEQLPSDANDVQKEFYDYYHNPKRGQHCRYQGTRYTSMASLMNFYPFAMIKDISPHPVLFIAGEKAHSRYFSEDAYKQACEPKELYVVPNANHVDLYDQIQKIPFDKITDFFNMYLNKPEYMFVTKK